MGNLIIQKKHVAINSSSFIQEICSDLFKRFGVSYFNYSRFNKDFSHTSLSSDGDWANFFYSEDYKNKFLYNENLFEQLDGFSYILWASFPENRLIQNLREYYGYDHGIIIIEYNETHNDYYSFAGYKNNPLILNFFINNLDLLRSFIYYFKEQGRDIIKEANNDKIILPNNLSKDENNPFDMDNYCYNRKIVESYLLNMKVKKYYLGAPDEKNYLTNKEYVCARDYICGFSSKEIALSHGMSFRTVQTHIESVMQKLQCNSRRSLRAALSKALL